MQPTELGPHERSSLSYVSEATTVCIRHDGVIRKITKTVPYSDGGFALLVPYHSARVGYLTKMPVDYSKRGEILVERAEIVEYTADDRVKLSYHPDGFVQFSGERAGKIISGRDPDTGEPRGIGVLTNPMREPMASGPNCGMQALR